ncbi:GDP/GTP exchange factor for ARF [Coemansia sp. RSA 2603]|nr:GDP/GTP exchange factor for ARF [Coemansia sp. RSA 2603]
MLNTDQHSPQVRARMRFDDFARNLRGVNGGADFDQGFLAAVFDAVRDAEIVFPEEHAGARGLAYAWQEAPPAWPRAPSCPAAMLRTAWPHMLPALEHAARAAGARPALRALHHVACSSVPEAASAALQALARLTRLYPTDALGAAAGHLVGRGADALLVTPLALEFAADTQAHAALRQLAHTAAHVHPAAAAWTAVLRVVCTAADVALLDARVLGDDAWVPSALALHAMDAAAPVQPAGLLSAFSALWSADASPRAESPVWRAPPDHLHAVRRARHAVANAPLAPLLASAQRLAPTEELHAFGRALAGLLPAPEAPYAAGAQFALELALVSLSRAPALWDDVEPAVQRLMAAADALHVGVRRRLVAGLLHAVHAALGPADRQAAAMTRCVALLRDATDHNLDPLAHVLASGLCRLTEELPLPRLLALPSAWDTVRHLLRRLPHLDSADAAQQARTQALSALAHAVQRHPAVLPDVVDLLVAYAPPDRALQCDAHAAPAAAHLVGLHALVLDAARDAAAWTVAANALAAYACCAARDTRRLACAQLQTAALRLCSGDARASAALLRVLLPLLDALLRADMLADPAMEDTHARCISLAASFFLHHRDSLPPDDMRAAWLRLVAQLAAYVHTAELAMRGEPVSPVSAHLGVLAEMAEECARNCLLVLTLADVLGSEDQLTRDTREALQRASPALRRRLMPEPGDERAKGEPSAGADAEAATETQPESETQPASPMQPDSEAQLASSVQPDSQNQPASPVQPESATLPDSSSDPLPPSEDAPPLPEHDKHRKKKNRVNIITVS